MKSHAPIWNTFWFVHMHIMASLPGIIFRFHFEFSGCN
jgi:hypothetical protein